MLNPFFPLSRPLNPSIRSPFSPYDDDDDEGNIVFLSGAPVTTSPSSPTSPPSGGGVAGAGAEPLTSSPSQSMADILSMTPTHNMGMGMGWFSFLPASLSVPDFNEVEPGLLIGDYFTVLPFPLPLLSNRLFPLPLTFYLSIFYILYSFLMCGGADVGCTAEGVHHPRPALESDSHSQRDSTQ